MKKPLLLKKAALVLATALMAMLAIAPHANAHAINESYLYFDILQDGIEGRLEMRTNDLNEVLGFDIVEGNEGEVDTDLAEDQLAAAQSTIEEYAAQHMTFNNGGADWDYSFTDISVLATESGTFAQLNFEVDENFAEVPRAWDVDLDVFFEEKPSNKAFVLISSYWEGGIFANEGEALRTDANALKIFSEGNTVQEVTIEAPSFFAGLWGTIDLGIEHIEIGSDHILFVLVLVLPSVMVFRNGSDGEGSWTPAPSLKDSLWKVLKIATMFTIAHSITLSLAGLGIFDLPGRPVEALIAISIVVAALHNLRPVFREKEWLIAFGFGLFHGLGFAGLLEGLGLDKGRKVWSLLGFNIGVEIGQAVIILMVFPLLFLLRRTRMYENFMKGGSILMALVAAVWAFERIFDTETSISDLVDKVLKFPRVLIPLAIATVAAALWRNYERDRDQLIDIEPEQNADNEPALV